MALKSRYNVDWVYNVKITASGHNALSICQIACLENLQIPRAYVNMYKSLHSMVTAGAYVAFGYE